MLSPFPPSHCLKNQIVYILNPMSENDVPSKAAHVLNIVLLAFSLIAVRVWYLAVVKHEEHVRLSKRPQHRVMIQIPSRGTIRDRYNRPLAVNKIRYNASIVYEPIRHLPRIKWETIDGKRQKVYYRKEYIERFSAHLAKELNLDPTYVEDVIYGKASIFPNTPFVLKENISEDEYYRLHIMERDWPGMAMEILAVRHYPMGKVASSILGYMGAINESKHAQIRGELNLLSQYLSERKMGLPVVLPKGYTSSKEVIRRYQELKDKSYTINSRIGKSGIEGKFDEELRGICGKEKVEVDIKGNVLRDLPESYASTPGRRILLSISSELQEYAEELLEKSELYRHDRFATGGVENKKVHPPWIKGGAVVALDPKTGEILAMATYPRFDPNDFVDPSKSAEVTKWLESDAYVGKLWDGMAHLERPFDLVTTPLYLPKEAKLTWNLYLDSVVSVGSSVKTAMRRVGNIGNAIYLQNAIQTLMKLAEVDSIHPLIDALFPHGKGNIQTFFETPKKLRDEIIDRLNSKTTLLTELVNELSPFLSSVTRNDDKIFVIDLCRLVCPSHLFDDHLLSSTGDESLSTYRSFNQSSVCVERKIRKIAKEVFLAIDFPHWRETYFSSYLKERRREEKEKKRHQKPYLDYLTAIQNELFDRFFEENRWELLKSYLLDNAPIDLLDARLPYFQAMIAVGSEEKDTAALELKDHLLSLPRELVVPYLKTMRSYRELNRPLLGKYYFPAGGGRNATEKHLARHFYPATGYGFTSSYAFQENAPFGSIFKVFTAYEGLRQRYHRIQSGERLDLNPFVILDQSPPYHVKLKSSSIIGYTERGKPITRRYKGGRMPRGTPNIGRIDLKGALERTSNMYFAILANEHMENPDDLANSVRNFGFGKKSGIELTREAPGAVPNDTGIDTTALYSFAMGQHSLIVTPLQGALALSAFVNDGHIQKPQIIHTIANLEPREKKADLFNKDQYSYQDMLSNVGVFFPLFTEVLDRTNLPYVYKPTPEVQYTIELEDAVRDYLLESLFTVVNGERGTARPYIIRTLMADPVSRRTYYNMRKMMGGKTSTAEIVYRPHLDREFLPIVTKHVWFGGIGFTEEDNPYSESDIVVLVYLRYGDYGKEAAPIAANLISKYREIKARYDKKESSL